MFSTLNMMILFKYKIVFFLKKMCLKSRLINNLNTHFIEVHNSISAKIAELCGFKALWASGLSISSSLGFSDRNELSWSRIINLLDFMKNSTSLPILVDCDSGFGNYLNLVRLVKSLCKLSINSICIEDKLFPKTNSFINTNHELSSTKEFCNKITAAKNEGGKNFTVIARTETFISNGSLDEALDRAYKYYKAGADAILIHSKSYNLNQIHDFVKSFNLLPVFIVPTKYFNYSFSDFNLLGIKNIIWANYLIRSSYKIMDLISKRLFIDKSLVNVENNVILLKNIFNISNEKNINKIEKLLFNI